MDFPWLSEMFETPFILNRVRSECPSDYVDPDSTTCDKIEPLSPTVSPTISLAPTTTPADCDLMPGDLAIVSFNSDAPDTFTTVALVPIAPGTQLFFTDRPWSGSEFVTSSEGVLLFSATDLIPAGSQFYYPNDEEVLGIWSKVSGSFNLATSGDQILIYCGTAESPNFLYALSNNGWLEDGEVVSSTTSALPDGLVAANATVLLSPVDNQYYNGSGIGTRTSLLDSIAQAANWNGFDSLPVPVIAVEFTVLPDTSYPTTSAAASRKPTVSRT